jgi:hypothetical protein
VLNVVDIECRPLYIRVTAGEKTIGNAIMDLTTIFPRQTFTGSLNLYSISEGLSGELDIELSLLEEVEPQVKFLSGNIPSFYQTEELVGFIEELVQVKFVKEEKNFVTQFALQEAVLKLR